MIIKILGTGCSKCQALEKETVNALAELNVAADVRKVTDMDEIMDYNVMMTPALVINEKVKSSGKVLSLEAIKKMIQEEL
ncbi:MAG: redox-active disulfide protein 2 [Firmicutes bacterium ML8_F2]|jgi:small redox-active disulfide protein 2|nr:MAG: redox-active disulfide protein 2 [Firmicutes bacterium ML8_F2]